MWSLFALALSLSPARVAPANIPSLLGDVVDVAGEGENLFPEDKAFGAYRTARVLLVWSAYESAGIPSALGDGGRACGRLQNHRHAWFGYSCDDIRKDGKLGLRLGLRYMIVLQKHFNGSLRLALQAYARGNAYKSPEAVEIVKTRCAIAGC